MPSFARFIQSSRSREWHGCNNLTPVSRPNLIQNAAFAITALTSFHPTITTGTRGAQTPISACSATSRCARLARRGTASCITSKFSSASATSSRLRSSSGGPLSALRSGADLPGGPSGRLAALVGHERRTAGLGCLSAVGYEGRAGHKRRQVGGEKQRHVRHFLRLAEPPQRDRFLELVGESGDRERRRQQRRIDRAGADAIRANPV